MRRPRPLVAAALLSLALITWLRVALVNGLQDQGFLSKYLVFAAELPRERLPDASPLYLWLIVLMGDLTPVAIRTLQIVAVSIAALLCAIAAKRAGGWIAAIAAAAIVLGNRAALVCATDIEPDTLILLLNAAAVAALTWDRLAASGAALGLSAAARPVAVLAIAALGLWRRSVRLVAAALLPIAIAMGVNFALTGHASLMNPGTNFYDGMNPIATGFAGVSPRIINELEARSGQPDYMHVAYRIVAGAKTPEEANRYWTGKALAFARAYPLAALRLTGRKLLLALHSYDAYDLGTMQRKHEELSRWPAVPFGLVVALAGAAVFFRRREVVPLVLFAVTTGLVLVVFYVSARQRNGMLPAMAVLAALGVVEIVKRRSWIAAVVVAAIALLLSVNGPAQTEDTYGWRPTPGGPEELFDRALRLPPRQAEEVLATIEDYRPRREDRAVSSVAYYRAVAALQLGERERAAAFAKQAEHEAPGDAYVLALLAKLGDRRADRLLDELHDPITAERARTSHHDPRRGGAGV